LITGLQQYRKECEKNGQYLEAEATKFRIQELKEKDYDNKKVQLDMNQQQQVTMCEEAHTRQMK
jgi:hypothetical protein